MTEFNLRPVNHGDQERVGKIIYDAFYHISNAHNFPPDFASEDIAVGLAGMLLTHPRIYGIVAESDGVVVGSNFLWEIDEVVGVGPITIDPGAQNSSIGKALMLDVIRRAEQTNANSVRLVQAAYHNRSLALYTKLGFDTVAPLSAMSGPAFKANIEGYDTRPMTADDVDNADAVCIAVHGISLKNEIADSVDKGSGYVVEHRGRITGYTTGLGYFGHTACITNEELKALIGSGHDFTGPGFLLPTTNSDVMRWCFENGLRIVHPMTLMSRGVYQVPRGAFMPSILY